MQNMQRDDICACVYQLAEHVGETRERLLHRFLRRHVRLESDIDDGFFSYLFHFIFLRCHVGKKMIRHCLKVRGKNEIESLKGKFR